MSLVDVVNTIEEGNYNKTKIEEFLNSLFPSSNELGYDYYEDFYKIQYCPNDTRLPKVEEAISLIPSDKWQETKPVFYKNEVKQSGTSFHYRSVYHFKIKAPNNGIYLISWEGPIFNRTIFKHSILNPYKKQVENALEKNINEILDRVKQNLYGSQRFVKNPDLVLFDDGILFIKTIEGMSEESIFEHRLAKLVIDIKNS